MSLDDRVPTIAEHAAYVASQCPPLTDEQKTELRRIFAAVPLPAKLARPQKRAA